MIKIDVWGKGRLGRDIIDLIGKEMIGVIVDKNVSSDEDEYEGIRIIGPDEYFSSISKNPIIVTPKGFEKEIIIDIKKHGIQNVYQYSDEFSSLVYFNYQIEGYNIVRNNMSDQENIVEGNNLLALIVKDYLSENADVGKNKKKKIFYCEPTNRTDGIQLANYNSFGEITYCRWLEKYKNIHRGKRCFIVATGPSLTIEDLEKLHNNNEICFSMNTIYKSYANTTWRPNYYMLGDSEVLRNNLDYLCKDDGVEKFVSDIACNPKYRERLNAKIFHAIRDDEDFRFVADFPKGTYIGGSIVIDGCLPLAVYMGFKEIYMIGNDCSYIKGATNNHFGVTEKPDMVNHGVDRMLYFYERIKEWMDTSDVKIYNATRGGALEVFERVNFDDLF